MKYLNKIWQYQKLLSSANPFGGIDQSASPGKGCLTFLVYFIMFGFFGYAFGNLCALQLVLYCVAMEYWIATNNKKVYAIVPVSKRFALLNLYLLPVIFSVIIYIVLYLLLLVFILFLWIAVIVFKIPQDTAPAPDVLLNPAGINTFLFCLMFVLIAIFVITAISVIRSHKTRIISLLSSICISSALMIWLKFILPSANQSSSSPSFTLGFEGILPGFEKMPHVEIVLIAMGLLLLIVAPISIKFAYNEYMREEIKKSN